MQRKGKVVRVLCMYGDEKKEKGLSTRRGGRRR
jgi:hypothetical protein